MKDSSENKRENSDCICGHKGNNVIQYILQRQVTQMTYDGEVGL